MSTDEPIIDAHHHIWWLARTPWLVGPPRPRIFGSYESLRRDYLIGEFASDARPSGVVKSVYVQINVAPGDEVAELGWASSAGASEGLIQGVVGFADLASPDVGDVLDRQLECAALRGIRQQLHWHEQPSYRFAGRPDVMRQPEWQRGLRALSERGLLFELQVFPGQYESALQLVASFPDVSFVLLHAGMLVDRSPEGWAAWRSGLEGFAAQPNVWLKLSGLGTFVRRCTVADWKPVVEQAVESFGPDRCMFGSNFPIEKLWTTYGELIGVFTACLESCTAHERRQIFYETADEVYRL